MRIKIIFAIVFLLSFIVVAHPIKMSLLYIQYKPESQKVYMECRIFMDDLLFSIEDETKQKINPNITDIGTQDAINTFINSHITVSFGRKYLNMNFYNYHYDKGNNVLTLKYEFGNIALIEGDKVHMSNNLFFDQFPYAQTNIFDLQIPKVAETTFQCSASNYSKTFTVKK